VFTFETWFEGLKMRCNTYVNPVIFKVLGFLGEVNPPFRTITGMTFWVNCAFDGVIDVRVTALTSAWGRKTVGISQCLICVGFMVFFVC
jgi:hypothetical protein